MEKIKDTSELELPNYLTKKQKKDINWAIKEKIPIIISGKQGPTGKTTLVDILKEQGIKAYELWECVEIKLDAEII